MAVITITRDFATGGRELGRLLAEKLGYQYVDKELLQKIAEDLHVTESNVKSFEKSREFWMSNLFAKLFSTDYIERITRRDRAVVEEEDYRKSLQNLIQQIARQDNVVIIGRAAHYFLKDFEKCYRFRLIAPMKFRVEYAVNRLQMDQETAEEYVKRRDRNHAWFIKTVTGKEGYDPLLFHMTLNTGLIPIAKAAELILTLIPRTS
ncbi:AAA family ATPase [Desulfoglaeba alkanexedens]|nr:cytidylate kinase-like family protein [Desulfoglaeba alkanexedens]